jgi:hypothetical protein
MRGNLLFRSTLVVVAVALAGIAGWLVRGNAISPSVNESRSQVSIEQILADPQKFAGKKVLLTGRLDECFGWECSICPEKRIVYPNPEGVWR